jgi:hypothetical protein
MQKITKKTVETIRTFCDICESPAPAPQKCIGCKIDLCYNCRKYIYIHPWTGTDNGDYPDIVCSDCNKKLIPWAAKAMEIMGEAEEKISRLEAAWEEECRAKGAN